MAKIKKLLDGLTQAELERELYNRYDDDYEMWIQSEDYVNYVNDIIEEARPLYSNENIDDALKYASKSIIIDPSEVGKEVYDKLFSEKIKEYLNEKF